MKYYINVTADTNDADYISEMNEISDEQLELIRPVIKAIKNFKPYKGKSRSGSDWNHENNFPTGDCYRLDLGEKDAEEIYVKSGIVTQEQFDVFMEFVPSNEYGIHTIESVHLYHVTEEENLL
jgi:hypothetical protein